MRWINGIGQSRVEILGTGDINVTASVNGIDQSITFSDALFAPKLGINLVSVGSITAKGGEIRFINSHVNVLRNGILILVGTRVGQTLYRLDATAPIHQRRSPNSFPALPDPSHNSIQEWHRRLAHLNYQMIIRMANSGAVTGLNLPEGTTPPIEHCHECAAGKMKRVTFHLSTANPSRRIGLLVVSDVWGPAQIKSLGGATYCATFRDDCSDYRAAYYLKTKAEVANSVKDFVHLLHTQTGELVACIGTDGGKEYESEDLEKWLRKKGIRHETTIRYSPQQNGIAERDNRTLFEGTRTLLQSNKSLPLSLWAEATNHKIYVLNRSISTTCPTITPHEAWFKKKPDLSKLRTFGSELYTLIPKQIRKGKLESVSQLVYFVGNSDTQKGERYYDPSIRKVNTSCDTSPAHHFYEPRLPSVNMQNDIEVFPKINEQPVSESNLLQVLETDEALAPDQTKTFPRADQHQLTPSEQPQKKMRLVRARSSAEEDQFLHARVPDPRRSTRVRNQKQFVSMNASTEEVNPNLTSEEPNQYQDAISCGDAFEWRAAMQREYESLMTNRTWELTPLPEGRSLIKARWTFKIKPAFKGTGKIYKARFVAKGYSQEAGIDYNVAEVYSPTLKIDSLRVLLSTSAVYDLELSQLDVKTAFLYGDLDEELYIEQPEGFRAAGSEHLVCRLKKPLYGLIQSARKWNEKFDSFIAKFGLTRSSSDPCIYFHRGDTADDLTLFGIWVDDGILATKNKETALAIIQHLEQFFEMKSKTANLFIGLEITRDRKQKKIFVSQTNYIESLLQKFNMADCHPSSVPADPGSRLSVKDCPTRSGKTPLLSTPYRSAVGGLMYVAKMTRPDILFAVTTASRFNTDPGKPHWEAVKRVLSYLAGTADHGLRYGGTDSANHLVGFLDSDFAGCEDTRRSTSGLIFMLNGGPISWTSHLQKPVSNSTAEAEYYAAGHASREIAWLRSLLKEIGLEQVEPTPLMCDNNSVIMMVHNPVFHNRTKHIDIKYHYVRQQYQAKNVELLPIPSKDELADMLTKPLRSQELHQNRLRVGVMQVPPV